MNLPKVITDLINAQNNFDSIAYTNCFSENAEVFDEGKTHNGKSNIQHWIEESNQKYRSVMKPLEYKENGISSVLSAECSGTFDGSPILLNFHFDIVDGQIESLKVTG
ncbi:nuclear transport factor 2 family protein [Flavobacterium sp. ANB]|uniref:nuclear transport factor 2 family protein n=1 Tax=unclassified Flavobacterium TaxID=196869 RepID=UPI0012B704FE|nr:MULTISPECIES: nuclear transport factor 2 family protein [unclassified Flavobacterium]MBF4515833.1 nuclear transport factor 2 family protein [Flavobacterium sp. ANB]MTD68835.1 nuclear transport factor 2 family protein [Flavobacterium sp. LC2016-13]